jgi:hypothetical protein
MTGRHVAMPEWLERDDIAARPWVVEEGAPRRGDAFTNLVTHRMRVPLGSDETSRCIRAHELMHAKVSPVTIVIPDSYSYLAHDTVVVAEEFRVNMLTGVAGFPVMKFLSDGSERRTGERLAECLEWNELVHMVAATAGTKSHNELLAGVRKVRPQWVHPLRKVTAAIRRHCKGATDNETNLDFVSSTTSVDGIPEGWYFTLEVARILHRALRSSDEIEDADAPDLTNLDDHDADPEGRWGRLIELSVDRTRRVDGRIGRRKRASVVGRNPRHIERLLTDPQRRIFERRDRGNGGVVLIDQSGSMRLTQDDLWNIIEAAPGCVVIGYSHAPGTDATPNIWVIAERGHVTEQVPSGNLGNGIDGPALHFALRKRRNGEPFIWVCDGWVTDELDQFNDRLTDECATIVATNGIHQVPDVAHAIAALGRAGRGETLRPTAIGPVATSDAWRSRTR